MTAGQLADAVELPEVPDADLVGRGGEQAVPARAQGDVRHSRLPRRHGQSPVGRHQLHRPVRGQSARAQGLDAGDVAHPQVPDLDEGGRHCVGHPRGLGVLDAHDIVRMSAETLDLLFATQVPDFDGAVFGSAEEQLVRRENA